MQSIISMTAAIVIIGLVIWRKTRRTHRPIKGNGLRMLIPVIIMFIVISFSMQQIMHIPGRIFHWPAYWELLAAGILGSVFGFIMLKHTEYERRADGLIYTKPNEYFKYILIAIIAIRFSLAQYFKSLDPIDFSVLMMIMGMIYIAIWRIGSYWKFSKLTSQINNRISP
ncbi:CcdC protein domain-containing protein [Brevibacillus ginsengisoli]|uniref:CcdC protein domain-containing protein n=1 Tax=Brevibacillus ginsengisoli TaxID=363854 RepID=UPI003CF5F610